METKQCLICAETHPLELFSKLKTGRNGLHPWCKTCLRQYWRDRESGLATRKRAASAKVGPPKYLRPKVAGVYEIVHTRSGLTYVGASRDIHARFAQHLSELRGGYSSCKELQTLFSAGGEQEFELRVTLLCPAEELQEREFELWKQRKLAGRSLNFTHAYHPGRISK